MLAKDEANCHALIRTNRRGHPLKRPQPAAPALTPSQLRDAYHLTGLSSGGRTVAIVDAYGYPRLASDLATYRSNYGLPSCTTSSGCLKVIDQNGGSNLPSFDLGWAQEQALDVDAVSAACPDCNIVMVQADSNSFADLGAAVNTAASQAGVVAVSNSYGGSDAPDSTYGHFYNHPGIAVTASTGDGGYQRGGSYPADSSYVTAVGGTSLDSASNARGWTESAWDGAGSGCSAYNTALAGAASYDTGCAKRAIADGRASGAARAPAGTARRGWARPTAWVVSDPSTRTTTGPRPRSVGGPSCGGRCRLVLLGLVFG